MLSSYKYYTVYQDCQYVYQSTGGQCLWNTQTYPIYFGVVFSDSICDYTIHALKRWATRAPTSLILFDIFWQESEDASLLTFINSKFVATYSQSDKMYSMSIKYDLMLGDTTTSSISSGASFGGRCSSLGSAAPRSPPLSSFLLFSPLFYSPLFSSFIFSSTLLSSPLWLHTLQARWLNYVLRSMSKHGRCVICREFPFMHYYSEGWAQLSASHGCAQHGSLCAQQGPSKPLFLSPSLPLLLSSPWEAPPLTDPW